MIMIGNGSHATPALTGLKPHTVWTYSVRKKNTEKSAVPFSSIMT